MSAHRVQEVRVGEVPEEGAGPLGEGLHEDVEGGHQQHEREVCHRDAHQQLLARRVDLRSAVFCRFWALMTAMKHT